MPRFQNWFLKLRLGKYLKKNIPTLFSAFDTNRDGTLNIDEFFSKTCLDFIAKMWFYCYVAAVADWQETAFC